MDQKTLDALLAKVIAQARQAGIPVSPSIDPRVRINRRARTRFGCCIQKNGRYYIELASQLLGAEEQAVCQVLAHEVLHTCSGCRNHGALWRSYAGRMNAAFGYTISRTGTCGELGVPDLRPVRHLVVCTRCGQEFPRTKASPLVLHPERYRCKCGGTLLCKY